MKRERGKPPIAVLARDGKHVGNAFITLPPGPRERFWQGVEENAGPPPKSIRLMGDATTTQWLRPGLIGRVRFLRDERSLRHATLRDWRDEKR